MRILLWHGYLLGGTGSNVYTRALAREWSRAGHDVVVVCQERAARSSSTSEVRASSPRSCPAAPAGVRPRPLRRARAEAAPGLHAGRARSRTSRRTPPRCARCCRPTRLRESRAARRAGRRGDRRAVPRQGARLGARVLDARPAGARAVGCGDARAGRGDVRRLRAHPRRCSRTSSATSTASSRCRRASTSTSSRCRTAARRSRDLIAEARRDPPNPGTRRSGCPTTTTPSGSRRSSPATSRRSSTSGS